MSRNKSTAPIYSYVVSDQVEHVVDVVFATSLSAALQLVAVSTGYTDVDAMVADGAGDALTVRRDCRLLLDDAKVLHQGGMVLASIEGGRVVNVDG